MSRESLQIEFWGKLKARILWRSVRLLRFLDKRLSNAYYRSDYISSQNRSESNLRESSAQKARASLVSRYYDHLRAQDTLYERKIKFSILVVLGTPSVIHLQQMLSSLAWQTYRGWELCVFLKEHNAIFLEILDHFGKAQLCKITILEPDNLPTGTENCFLNECLNSASGEFSLALGETDRLYPNALSEILRYINVDVKAQVLYSDERFIDHNGDLYGEPYFKPAWSPILHLNQNYVSRLSVFSTNLAKRAGGFSAVPEVSQEYDLMLRMVELSPSGVCHINCLLYQRRIVQGTGSQVSSDRNPAIAALHRKGLRASQSQTDGFGDRLKIEVTGCPSVSLIIPFKDGYQELSACLRSIFSRTSYKNFEAILVNNGTTDLRCLELLEDYKAKYPTQIRLLHSDRPFNFAHLNNIGIAKSRSEYITLLNADTEVLTSDWLQEILAYAQLATVGAVGCKLLYPDRTIQHAGIVLLGKGLALAGHLGRGLPRDSQIYKNILNQPHEVSAVTGACLTVSREKFLLVGGLDELYVPNAYGDIDLCLALRIKGLSTVYTPYAELIHHESKFRGFNIELFESDYMLRKWGGDMLRDAYQNLHLDAGEIYEINKFGSQWQNDAPLEILETIWQRSRS